MISPLMREQSFHPPTTLHDFYRYLRIDFLSHYSNEFYCPVSLLRVYGLTHLEQWKWDTLEAENRARLGPDDPVPAEVGEEPPAPAQAPGRLADGNENVIPSTPMVAETSIPPKADSPLPAPTEVAFVPDSSSDTLAAGITQPTATETNRSLRSNTSKSVASLPSSTFTALSLIASTPAVSPSPLNTPTTKSPTVENEVSDSAPSASAPPAFQSPRVVTTATSVLLSTLR